MVNVTDIIFFERKFPSANMVLVKDEKPTLFDTGFGSDIEETESLIEQTGIQVSDLDLIVNTHYHSDHVGGNHYLQQRYGTKIAAHKWDACLINKVDRETGCAEYLDQPIEQYEVDIILEEGSEINTGNKTFQVIHTPGHTLGHISFYEPNDEILIVGDLFHRDDLGWLNIFREGVSAINRSVESLEKLKELPIKIAYSGHGSPITQPIQTIERAIDRLNRWASNTESIGWHACKRIYAYTLIIKNGMHKNEIHDYLLTCAWFHDFSQYIFRKKPSEFVNILIDEMIRSRAAIWDGDILVATAPYDKADSSWMEKNIQPKDWKK